MSRNYDPCPAVVEMFPATPEQFMKEAYALSLTSEAVEKLEQVKQAADFLSDEAARATTVQITDDASNITGSELAVNLTKGRKMLEELQKYFTSPLEARKKQVIAWFKNAGEAAIKEEERLRAEAAALWTKKENARREAETKRITDEAAAQKKARSLGRSAPAPIAAAPIEEPARSTATENGTLGITLEWTATLTDPALVPDKYWVIDQKAVDADVRGGTREITGYLIQQRPKTAVR